MSNHICVPTNKNPVLHFGSLANYERLDGCYFEEENYDDNNYLYKSIIISIIYKPDTVYTNTCGYYGNCWVAKIIDSKEENKNLYYFRNFVDLVKMYKEKGYKYIDKQEEETK
jgi:hypothetical protein